MNIQVNNNPSYSGNSSSNKSLTSFGSKIRLVCPQIFEELVSDIPRNKYVAAPWTTKESVISQDRAYTDFVIDCTVCVLTDLKKFLMMHLCPTKEENKSFLEIAAFMTNRMDFDDKNLKAFLIGSKPESFLEDLRSSRLFESLENYFNKHKIPCTSLKGGNHLSTHSVAYDVNKDELLLSNDIIDLSVKNKKIAKDFLMKSKMFDFKKISELDDISW